MLRQVIDEIEQLHRAIASRRDEPQAELVERTLARCLRDLRAIVAREARNQLSAARSYKSCDAFGDRQLHAVNSLITSRVIERRGRALMPYFSALLQKTHRRGDIATPVANFPLPSASRKRSRV
jgi:hypothetical protein